MDLRAPRGFPMSRPRFHLFRCQLFRLSGRPVSRISPSIRTPRRHRLCRGSNRRPKLRLSSSRRRALGNRAPRRGEDLARYILILVSGYARSHLDQLRMPPLDLTRVEAQLLASRRGCSIRKPWEKRANF